MILKRIPGAFEAYQVLHSLRHLGLKGTYYRIKRRILRRRVESVAVKQWALTPEGRAAQEAYAFAETPLLSIVTPLYNTPQKMLRQLLDSVRAQTYPHFELCLPDGSDAEHAYVGDICRAAAAKDPRIRYQKLPKNEGISGNTNRGMEMATGTYISLLDHDDCLHPSALFETARAIVEQGADFVYTDEVTFQGRLTNAINIHCKPDFAPDNLRANNYICHFTTFSRALLDKAGGGFQSDKDGSQDYDLVLRLTEKARCIVHVPQALYFWRRHGQSVALDVGAKPYAIDAAKRALAEHLARVGLEGAVEDAPRLTSIYRINYRLTAMPKISILIPNRDEAGVLRRCISSILEKSTYPDYEILVVENGSTVPETFAYYQEIEALSNVRVLRYSGAFHFGCINNFAATQAVGDVLLLLNNDIEVITPSWMEEMLMYAQRPDVGAVGAKLLFPDGTIQHSGIVIDGSGTIGHIHYKENQYFLGYMGRMFYAQNYSAVTAACLMVRKAAYGAVDGFTEGLGLAYDDVDFCLKLRAQGLLNVWTPFAQLIHYESMTRGSDLDPEKEHRMRQDQNRLREKWPEIFRKGDPYYNPNLRLEGPQNVFNIRITKEKKGDPA